MRHERKEERQRSGAAGADIQSTPSLEDAADDDDDDDGTTNRENFTTLQQTWMTSAAMPPLSEMSATDAATQKNNPYNERCSEQGGIAMNFRSELASSQPCAAFIQTANPTAFEHSSSVGAVSVRARAYGSRPAWSRNHTPNSASGRLTNDTTESNVPPEMRGIVESSEMPLETRASLESEDQSHLPPEIRAVAPPPESSAGHRHDSEVIVAEVFSALVEEAKERDTITSDGYRCKTILFSAIMLLILALVVGVVVGLSVRETENSSEVLSASTENPSASPTGSDGGCPEYYDVLHYTDPYMTDMSTEVQALYEDLLGDTLIPTTKKELCSPKNLATVWVANRFAGQNATNQTHGNQLALATLYFHWKGQGISSTWLNTNNECEWVGVVCNDTGKIVEISNSGSGLRGDPVTLPTEIGLMTDLKSLRLPSIRLSGTIPDTIGALTNLVILDLHNNEAISGSFSFDTILNLKALRSLNLSQNYNLATRLPPSLLQWTNLEVLSLADLGSSSIGTIPTDIVRLSLLKFLNLSQNGVEGSVDFIAGLEQLLFVSLYNGAMVGTIPTSIGKIENLEWLLLGNNVELSGPLPSELGRLSWLAGAHFLGTQIGDEGTIPREIMSLSSLVSFSATDLDDNVEFTLSELPNLKCLDIQTTFLEGRIVSDSMNGTCTLELQNGKPVLDVPPGFIVDRCVAMDRATCSCCETTIECQNPLFLAHCDAYMRVDEIARSMEGNLTNQIAIKYVY